MQLCDWKDGLRVGYRAPYDAKNTNAAPMHFEEVRGELLLQLDFGFKVRGR